MTRPAYLVGTSGWVYPHWRGRFYPARLPQARWFEFYARHFPTVEINNTFYRLPGKPAVMRWRQQAPQGFVYAVKINRFITHIKRLKDTGAPLRRFLQIIRPLERHLGPVLVQLPASFSRTAENLARLRAFFRLLPSWPRWVVEFRHRSWFVPEVYALMEEHRVALCVVSDPSRPSEDRRTSDFLYVRFHGPSGTRYHGNYPERELRAWAGRIAALAEGRPAYVYFNNDYNAYAVRNALRLRELLESGL
jgi:uncharacterized protein YecE (DUF72 family)